MENLKFVIDAMGGDNGPKVIVEAINNFLNKNPKTSFIVCGKKDELVGLNEKCEVINATDVVPMNAGALEVMRMKNSSMLLAIKAFKENEADAILSCGSTGGFLSASTINLKLIPGIKRAAIVAPFPSQIKGKKVVILDVGANNENSPEELLQFAKMGRLYSQHVYGVNDPKTFLLSNGIEEGKGSPESKEAYKLFVENKFPSFGGNIEARNALDGSADVIVTDGFTGNIFLKGTEGIAKFMGDLMKKAFKRNIWAKLGYLHVRKGIKEISSTMDYKSTGGGMLLGVNGVVVKAHGSSDAYSFECALNVAKSLVEHHINEKIKDGINTNGN